MLCLLFSDKDEKSIHPLVSSDKIESQRYVVRGIFFKLATNKYGIYSSDEGASKVAGHLLKSIEALSSCKVKGLHFPLIALVDYRGYRLVAMSVLPISKETLFSDK